MADIDDSRWRCVPNAYRLVRSSKGVEACPHVALRSKPWQRNQRPGPSTGIPSQLSSRGARTTFEALPGYRLKLDLKALNRCSYTFGRNAEELSRHVGQFLLSRTTLARELSDEYVNELVRLLHNYLTSITTLIDAERSS
jgi:hypothetical protein